MKMKIMYDCFLMTVACWLRQANSSVLFSDKGRAGHFALKARWSDGLEWLLASWLTGGRFVRPSLQLRCSPASCKQSHWLVQQQFLRGSRKSQLLGQLAAVVSLLAKSEATKSSTIVMMLL